MKVAIPKERHADETRVAATPDTVKRLIGLGLDVVLEAHAGDGAAIPDAAFRQAGAEIAGDGATALKDADIVLKVRRPMTPKLDGPSADLPSPAEAGFAKAGGFGPQAGGALDELAMMRKGAALIGLLAPQGAPRACRAYAEAGITAFAMELMPRISRAQSMDALSSQSNLAGYMAVIEAAAAFQRAFPMMMTPAGTVPPARVMVLGVGVAGLQAIATARRLGAVVSATDVRPATKEEVKSLGAKFVAVEDEEFLQAESQEGYAKEMSDAYKEKQAALIHETLKTQDIAICTALIPGRPSPVLITEAMVKDMKPGSVIVDLAVDEGGNCALSEAGEVVHKAEVTIIGPLNLPGRVAASASALYARNLFNFLEILVDKDKGALDIDLEDEIVKGTLIAHDGKVVHPELAGEG
ncbi:MAG: Re/Si-specific NAD(P)(+) transhydrogenase subunit alpha [Kiloniellales bacterium]